MKAVEIIEGTCLPLQRTDVDTDQIIPSNWLKRVERTGFERGLFSEWRDDPDFVLNNEDYAGAKILLAGANFGTGSSREHAVWAIQQYGFEAVISPRFGDIFKNNSTKCGLIPVELSQQFVDKLFAAVKSEPRMQVLIDIKKLEVQAASNTISASEKFYLEPATQERLIKGLDDIDLTLQLADQISDYETKRPAWLKR